MANKNLENQGYRDAINSSPSISPVVSDSPVIHLAQVFFENGNGD